MLRTRKILNRNFPFDIVGHMLQYGFYLGCLVGFFGSIVLAFMLFDSTVELPLLFVQMLIGGIFGGIIGVFYGAISGFVSGLAMAFVTHIFFRDIRWQKIYKFVMGAITFISTLIIFLTSNVQFTLPQSNISTEVDPMFGYLTNQPLLGISDNAWHSLWIMSLVFAVYASQRTATKYLRHADVRKRKVR